jgi:hypothetical protein
MVWCEPTTCSCRTCGGEQTLTSGFADEALAGVPVTNPGECWPTCHATRRCSRRTGTADSRRCCRSRASSRALGAAPNAHQPLPDPGADSARVEVGALNPACMAGDGRTTAVSSRQLRGYSALLTWTSCGTIDGRLPGRPPRTPWRTRPADWWDRTGVRAPGGIVIREAQVRVEIIRHGTLPPPTKARADPVLRRTPADMCSQRTPGQVSSEPGEGDCPAAITA